MTFRRLFLIGLLVLGIGHPIAAQAATFYIDDNGSDAAAGTSTSVPWKTFASAMTQIGDPCGDTLIVMDRTYTTAVHGALTIASKVCTVGTVFTVQAQNQRAAWLQGNGGGHGVSISASAYVTIDGLRVTSTDNAGASCCFSNVIASAGSHHITLRNLLVTHNNRYKNTHLITLQDTTNSLIEDTEVYYFHRHAVFFGIGGTSNVARRIYCNSRAYADIGGGFVSDTNFRGDSCVMNYPGGSNVVENSISEGQATGFGIESDGAGDNVKFYGNISLNEVIGTFIRARGSGLTGQPENTVIANSVSIAPVTAGFYFQGNLNTQCTNCTTLLSPGPTYGYGFLINVEPTFPGSGAYSVFGTNLLSVSNLSGFNINIAQHPTWTMTNSKAFGNSVANYTPSNNANWVPTNPPTATDPVLGTCRVWIPDASPMKGAGAGGGRYWREHSLSLCRWCLDHRAALGPNDW